MARSACLCYAVLFQVLQRSSLVATARQERWTETEAREWFARQPWRVGANYLPSHCGNVLDFWNPDTFSWTLLTAERELRVAKTVGMTTLRIFLHEQLYFAHGDAFLDMVDRFLAVMQRHGLVAMLVLFEAVWRPDLEDARPLPGVHNSAWVQCPTHDLLRRYAAAEPAVLERLRGYVRATVRRFGADPRVAVWDIYNEASMTHSEHWILPRLVLKARESSDDGAWTRELAVGDGLRAPAHWLVDDEKIAATLSLMAEAFAWARAEGPSQPLTACVWDFPDDVNGPELRAVHFRAALALSDVISLHCYCEPEVLEIRLQELGALKRPIFVTEFMARQQKSTFATSLPILKQYRSWGYSWGLFRGESQTHLPWDTWQLDAGPADRPWFHDVFHANGTAYDPEDVKALWWHTVGSELRL